MLHLHVNTAPDTYLVFLRVLLRSLDTTSKKTTPTNYKQEHNRTFTWTNMDGYLYVDGLSALLSRLSATRALIAGPCTCTGICDKLHGPQPRHEIGLERRFCVVIAMSSCSNRWYIPLSVYNETRFPHYCMGYTLIMTPPAVQAILQVAEQYSHKVSTAL